MAAQLAPLSKLPHDPTRHLQAVNGNRIRTFGKQVVKIHPPYAKVPYHHTVTIGEIQQPILGWDFIVADKLDMN